MPSAVGRYRIDRVLGSGAFASVWLAHDEVLDAPVAVKVLNGGLIDDLDVRNRFLEEARILRRADSERLVRVHDIGELSDGRPYFVMSYADLGTLADRMRQRRMSVAEALSVAAEVARGVEVINRLGIIHRDLKPSNVLFQSTTDGGERLLIADLGLAKALAHASGAFTLPVGTPGYMSPEQARFGGGLDVRADVYGLGALTYHLVTGHAPSTAPVVVPPSAVRPELSPAIDAVVMRALETDRERRWPSAEAFAAALGDPVAAASAPPPGSGFATAVIDVELAAGVGAAVLGVAGTGPPCCSSGTTSAVAAAAGAVGTVTDAVVASKTPAVARSRAAVRWNPPSSGIDGARSRRAEATSSTSTDVVNAAQAIHATAARASSRKVPSSGEVTRSHSCPQLGTRSGRYIRASATSATGTPTTNATSASVAPSPRAMSPPVRLGRVWIAVMSHLR